MLDITGLCHSYAGRQVLFDLEFSVRKGEILGFLGPNGAGKSTTMKILTGCMTPSRGRVVFDGRDIADDPLHLRRRLGYLPETAPTYPELTVDEYLRWVAAVKGADAPAAQAAQVAGLCGLAEVRRKLIGHLSRGYRQRVGLAQALLGRAEVLILDEPTVGLDPTQIREIRALIRELGQERTIILSTHILPEVELTCDRVLILSRGRIIAEDTPADLVRRVGGRGVYLLRLGIEHGQETAAAERLRALPFVRGVSVESFEKSGCVLRLESDPSEDRRARITREAFEAGWPVLEFSRADATLEEAFVSLVRDEEEVEHAR